MKIKFRDFLSVFWRSFFIQAVWNYTNMLALGFCYSLVPIARRLYENSAEQKEFLLRHLEFFNAHPYFTSFALGAISKIEEEEALSGNHDYSRIERFKSALIGPLGAIGDQLVWGLIKPASILFGITGVIILPDMSTRLIFLVVFLVIYNLPHLYFRGYGLYIGYQQGFDVYKSLNLDKFKFVKLLYGTLGAVSLGIYTGFTLGKAASETHAIGGVFIISIISAYWLRIKEVSFLMSILIILIVSILAGVIIEAL